MRAVRLCLIWSCVFLFALRGLSYSRGDLPLPRAFPPEMYGDVLMERTSKANKVIPVVFSHWVHRAKYTCRVCHTELEFSMKAGETPVVCDNGSMRGKYCAGCHNGKISFGPSDGEGEKCVLCHNAKSSPNREKFEKLQEMLPKNEFGNEIDWMKALKEERIKPRRSLAGAEKVQEMSIDRTLTLKAEMSGIPDAVFPHKSHEQWLDCSNCHPDLFNIKKKTTENLSKASMLKGESCGTCHLRVAFPLNDCRRCHPSMKK